MSLIEGGNVSTKYENDTPVVCRWTILDLLYRRWGDGSWRRLSRWPHAPNHVEVSHEGGDHGRGCGSVNRYLVDPDVVRWMVEDGSLEGKKEWGYTEMKELYISDMGSRKLHEKWKEIGGCNEYGHVGGGIPASTTWLARRRWR